MTRWWAVAAALVAAAVVVVPLTGDPDAPDFAAILAGPSPAHPLGTDQLGRDLLLRLLAGAQLTLGISVLTVLVTGAVGIAAGMVAGYRGGPGARVLLRAVDVLAALPAVLFGLLAAAVLGPGIGSLLVAVWLVGWTPFARQAYQLTVVERGRDYVEGAVALGAGPVRVLTRHVARNLAPPLLAHACVRFAATLLTVSGLSFLGLGVAPPTAEWGAMVAEGREYLFVAPHVVLVPSVAVVAVAVLVTVAGRRIVTSDRTRR
ncbi:MAG: ABC transporter permease [Pseudonocardia sediminis]